MPTMDETLAVWRTAEQFVPHKIRNLGISNCNQFVLMELYEEADIKPAVVQNRFYANTKFDVTQILSREVDRLPEFLDIDR